MRSGRFGIRSALRGPGLLCEFVVASWGLGVTYIVLHTAVVLAPHHIDLPPLADEVLPEPAPVAIAVGGVVSDRDRCT